MLYEPFYGHIAMNMVWIPSEMSWIPDERSKTMGVRIVGGGETQCLYYPPFVDSLSIEEIYTVVQHEIEHILRVHCLRIYDRDALTWNYACDMTINGPKDTPRIGYVDERTNSRIIPHKDEIIWIPDNWPCDETAEYYYERLLKDASKKYANYKLMDDHSTWDQSDVSEDEARQVVKDLVDSARDKTQGNIPQHLVSTIQNLSKPVVRWRELLKHYLGKYVGSKRYSFSRRNRRRDEFGLPGISHHNAADVTVIVDTSGSVSKKELQQFFAEIDMISTKATTHILQWDHAFQGYAKYRRGDWKKFNISGRGGTNMAEPIYWLKVNRKVSDITIMLTDGETKWASKSEVNFPFITVITRQASSNPTYGHVVRMQV
jgi:predicted metal-dependent peptidase